MARQRLARGFPGTHRNRGYNYAAFIAAGSLGSVALCLWVAPAVTPMPPPLFLILAPVVATVVAAFVETIPIKLDDNLTVPAAAASVLWIAAQVDRPTAS